MLVWPIAATAPSRIEAEREKITICRHCAAQSAERVQQHADGEPHRGDLGGGGEEGGDRRRRALVDVGRPHVERHRGDLEGEAGEHEDEAETAPVGRPHRRTVGRGPKALASRRRTACR